MVGDSLGNTVGNIVWPYFIMCVAMMFCDGVGSV